MKDVNTTVIEELTPEQIAASRARRKAEVALYKDSVIDLDKVRDWNARAYRSPPAARADTFATALPLVSVGINPGGAARKSPVGREEGRLEGRGRKNQGEASRSNTEGGGEGGRWEERRR